MRLLITIVAVLVLLAMAVLAAALAMNRVPLREPPGLTKRLGVYLNTNVAQTRTGHDFAELRPRRYPVEPAAALDGIGRVLRELGYEDVSVDVRRDRVTAVAVTPLLRFKDDVRVDVRTDSGAVVVNVRSESRVGKGDLGANTRHVVELFDRLDGELGG